MSWRVVREDVALEFTSHCEALETKVWDLGLRAHRRPALATCGHDVKAAGRQTGAAATNTTLGAKPLRTWVRGEHRGCRAWGEPMWRGGPTKNQRNTVNGLRFAVRGCLESEVGVRHHCELQTES